VPLYEYECPKCHHRFELIEKVGAPETHKCPKCGAKAERLLAAPAIQFKGSGWYVTDYAGKSGGASGSDGGDKSSEKSGNSDKSAKGEKKESKPEKSATPAGGKSAKKS
jgi:putative FmdB family regulatory protein